MLFLALIVAGFALGLIVSSLRIRSLKAEIRLYESYIHNRIDKQWTGSQESETAWPTFHHGGRTQ